MKPSKIEIEILHGTSQSYEIFGWRRILYVFFYVITDLWRMFHYTWRTPQRSLRGISFSRIEIPFLFLLYNLC